MNSIHRYLINQKRIRDRFWDNELRKFTVEFFRKKNFSKKFYYKNL